MRFLFFAAAFALTPMAKRECQPVIGASIPQVLQSCGAPRKSVPCAGHEEWEWIVPIGAVVRAQLVSGKVIAYSARKLWSEDALNPSTLQCSPLHTPKRKP